MPPLRLSNADEQPRLSRQLSSHSLQLLSAAFRQLDTNGDGLISLPEAVQYYSKIRQTLEPEQNAAMMMAEFDKAPNSLITFDEWASKFKSIQCSDETLENVLENFGFLPNSSS